VALRLQKDKTAIPAALRAETDKLVRTLVRAEGKLPDGILKADFDVTQTRPRGHYTRSKELERFFRAMSWLGMASFPVEGKHVDVEAVALLARSWLGSKAGREGLERLMKVTTFFAGGADTAGLGEAAAVLGRVLPGAESASADALVAPELQAKLQSALALALAPPRIKTGQPDASEAPRQVRVLGRRAFADAVAMQELVPVLGQFASATNVPGLVAGTMGARGAAAVLGSAVARDSLMADMPGASRAEIFAGLTKGQESVAALRPEGWSEDAYHGTLQALRSLLDPPPAKSPPLLLGSAWRLRALQAFAAGWAELRHDTILYGEQLGAECDVEDLGPPPCWVEPVPELYRRLAAMVRDLGKRLASARVDAGFRPEEKAVGTDGIQDATTMIRAPAEKTKMLLQLLDKLAKVADIELKGGRLDRDTLTWMTTIGGTVEWMLAAFSNSDELPERDADMAVVADVFTWRPSAQVLEVGVARPDLIYAIIPSPGGPVLARGAIMSYREFLHPQASRLTDHEWRKQIAAGRTPARPLWLAPLYADPVGPVALPKAPQPRCGPMSGAYIECL